MNPTTFRILFAVFLVAHGYIHLSLAQVPTPQPGGLHTPFFPSWWRDAVDPAWPVMRLGLAPQAARLLGWVLWLAVFAAYALAGAALLLMPAQPAVWQACAAAASLLSLALLGLYWHAWLPVGVLIDLALLSIVFLRWPVLPLTAQ